MSSAFPSGAYIATLHNLLQSQGKAHQLTWEEDKSGPGYNTVWTVTARVEGVVIGVGRASKKKVAKDLAAEQALEDMGVNLKG